MNAHDIIIKPVLTEKSYEVIGDKTYVFIVAKKAGKTEIKQATRIMIIPLLMPVVLKMLALIPSLLLLQTEDYLEVLLLRTLPSLIARLIMPQ